MARKNLISFELKVRFLQIFSEDFFESDGRDIPKNVVLFESEKTDEKDSAICAVSFIGDKANAFVDMVDEGKAVVGDRFSLMCNASTRIVESKKGEEICITEISCWKFENLSAERKKSEERRGTMSERRSAVEDRSEEIPEVENYRGTGRDGRSYGKKKDPEQSPVRKKYAPR